MIKKSLVYTAYSAPQGGQLYNSAEAPINFTSGHARMNSTATNGQGAILAQANENLTSGIRQHPCDMPAPVSQTKGCGRLAIRS